jgi:excisionase family DNA binding protein
LVEVIEDQSGDLVLVLKGGISTSATPLVQALNSALAGVTTTEHARRAVWEEALDYKAAARALGVSKTWLERRVARDSIPHLKVGRSVRFTGADIESIRQQFRHGPSYQPQGGRPPLQGTARNGSG